jgi:hypothetical protein
MKLLAIPLSRVGRELYGGDGAAILPMYTVRLFGIGTMNPHVLIYTNKMKKYLTARCGGAYLYSSK